MFMVFEISITITTAISGSLATSLIFWFVCTWSVISNTFSRSVPEIVLLTLTVPSSEVFSPPLSLTCTSDDGTFPASATSPSSAEAFNFFAVIVSVTVFTSELLPLSLYSSNHPLSRRRIQFVPSAASAIVSCSSSSSNPFTRSHNLTYFSSVRSPRL